MNDDVTVLVQFKSTASAFQLDGDGDGGQMTFVFDRSQVASATAAWAEFSGKGFEITFAAPREVHGD